jgi:hypothetical protein
VGAKALWDCGLRCYSVLLSGMTLFLFGTERSEVQILSPRPKNLITCGDRKLVAVFVSKSLEPSR